VTHLTVRRLTYVSAAATLGALALMVASLVSPKPVLLVFAMSVGQGLGTLSLATFLLAIALDLQSGGAMVDQVEEEVAEIKSAMHLPDEPAPEQSERTRDTTAHE
jgi:hypothetical protein